MQCGLEFAVWQHLSCVRLRAGVGKWGRKYKPGWPLLNLPLDNFTTGIKKKYTIIIDSFLSDWMAIKSTVL